MCLVFVVLLVAFDCWVLVNSVVIEVLSIIWVCYGLHYVSGCLFVDCFCCFLVSLALVLWFGSLASVVFGVYG